MEKIFEGIEIADEIKKKIAERVAIELTEKEKLATVNANRILDSVGKTVTDKFGIERDITKFPKLTDFLTFASEEIAKQSLQKSEKILTEKEQTIKHLEEKIKAGVTDETTKKEIENFKSIINKLNNDLELTKKEKEEIAQAKDLELNTFKQEIAIKNALPIEFDKNIDEYRIKYKKDEAIAKLKSEYNLIVNERGELIGESKTDYSKIILEDFFKKELKDLFPKVQTGGGANPNNAKLNFTSDLGKNIQLIESHLLATKFKTKADKGFAEEFQKMLNELKK